MRAVVSEQRRRRVRDIDLVLNQTQQEAECIAVTLEGINQRATHRVEFGHGRALEQRNRVGVVVPWVVLDDGKHVGNRLGGITIFVDTSGKTKHVVVQVRYPDADKIPALQENERHNERCNEQSGNTNTDSCICTDGETRVSAKLTTIPRVTFARHCLAITLTFVTVHVCTVLGNSCEAEDIRRIPLNATTIISVVDDCQPPVIMCREFQQDVPQ